MKIILLIVSFSILILTACAQSSGGAAEYIEVPAEGIPICGEVDGQKQTFPSIEELNNYGGARYLYDGPCYE